MTAPANPQHSHNGRLRPSLSPSREEGRHRTRPGRALPSQRTLGAALPIRHLPNRPHGIVKKKKPERLAPRRTGVETNGQAPAAAVTAATGLSGLKWPDQEMPISRLQRSGCSAGNDTPIHTPVNLLAPISNYGQAVCDSGGRVHDTPSSRRNSYEMHSYFPDRPGMESETTGEAPPLFLGATGCTASCGHPWRSTPPL